MRFSRVQERHFPTNRLNVTPKQVDKATQGLIQRGDASPSELIPPREELEVLR